jgi:hypothetical protein
VYLLFLSLLVLLLHRLIGEPWPLLLTLWLPLNLTLNLQLRLRNRLVLLPRRSWMRSASPPLPSSPRRSSQRVFLPNPSRSFCHGKSLHYLCVRRPRSTHPNLCCKLYLPQSALNSVTLAHRKAISKGHLPSSHQP